MKIKQLRKLFAALFPTELAPVFERCHTAKELDLVASTARVASAAYSKLRDELIAAEAVYAERMDTLGARITHLEEGVELNSARAVRAVAGIEPKEEVWLIRATESIRENASFINRIGLIKAVREVTNLGLKEAKDLVEDVIYRGTPRSVFKGSTDKCAVAARVLDDVGGVTERKEAF